MKESNPTEIDPSEDEREIVRRIVYSSVATRPFDDEALFALLEEARANNQRMNVSGMLLYSEGTFLQVLEGDSEVVESLFARIEEDDRHDETLILLRAEGEREFGDWTMGFVRATPDLVREIDGLSNFLKTGWRKTEIDEQAAADKARKILDQFREGRWRREIE